MPAKSYTQISSFWFFGLPAAVLGLGYYLWHSHGFVALQVRQILTPLVTLISQLFAGLV